MARTRWHAGDFTRNDAGTGHLSRRRFLLGLTAAGVVASCSSSDEPAADRTAEDDGGTPVDPSDAPGDPTGGSGDEYTLVQRFPQNVQGPGQLRLPISLSTPEAELILDGPASLTAQVTDLDGNPIGEAISAVRRDAAPAPYYDFRPTIDQVGLYSLVIPGGPAAGATFQVSDPASIPVPQAGDLLPGFDTPTTGDPRGVDPICTRTPEPCPYHSITLAEALKTGRPVAYYVGTPAFCSTGSCAPALESMLELQPSYGDRIVFVHAEVYTDTTATTVAPAVEAVGMFYEPALFVTDASGVIIERLDAVWDTSELREVLDRAVS